MDRVANQLKLLKAYTRRKQMGEREQLLYQQSSRAIECERRRRQKRSVSTLVEDRKQQNVRLQARNGRSSNDVDPATMWTRSDYAIAQTALKTVPGAGRTMRRPHLLVHRSCVEDSIQRRTRLKSTVHITPCGTRAKTLSGWI